jgi:hypothetical protein
VGKKTPEQLPEQQWLLDTQSAPAGRHTHTESLEPWATVQQL